MDYINQRVHELYWKNDYNCARTMLFCLREIFEVTLEKQTIISAAGLHGAGGFRAQCGLVEGGLMFIGIYYHFLGRSEEETDTACYKFADTFRKRFGSLTCYELRPGGFTPNDPPHMCEELTCQAVGFACDFMKDAI